MQFSVKGGTGNHQVEGISNSRAGVRCEHRQIISQLSHQNFRMCSWNVGTMRGRSNEVVEVMSRRKVDISSLQEVRWRGASATLHLEANIKRPIYQCNTHFKGKKEIVICSTFICFF